MKQILIILFTFGVFLFFKSAEVHANTDLKTVEFFVNNSANQTAPSQWFNTTFSILLPESSVTIKSAFFEIYGVSPSGTAGNITILLNGTYIANLVLAAGGEWYGFRFL